MRILLTGITGYLGSHLANALLNAGYEVVGLKRQSSSLQRIESILPKVMLYDLDDTNLTIQLKQIGKIDGVIHTATCYGRKGEEDYEILSANLIFPFNLLNAAINIDAKFFINTDTALANFLNPYALSKGQFAEWGRYFAQQKKIRFLNLKLEHFYGPSDDKSKFTTYVINSCLDNVPELKLTLGGQQRDFIYIDDVVTAYMLLLEKQASFSDNFIEYEVGSGSSMTIRKFAETAHQLIASKTRLNFGALPYRTAEVMYSEANIDGLKALGWSCRHSFEAGLKKVIELERKQL